MYKFMRVSLLFGLLSLCLFSCTAEDPTTPEPPVLSDNTKILTTGTWVYYEYFNGYNDSQTKLTWKAGKANSYRNMSKIWVKFNADSTVTETNDNGVLYHGTWTFLNNETQIRVSNSEGIFISNIKVLADSLFEWHDVADNTFGVMMHEFPKTDSSRTRKELLTGRTWIYNEYFNNYNIASTDLTWKLGKANSSSNYSKIWVQFNADGTVTETDQDSVLYKGTWTFLNNETQVRVSNSKGVFTSEIKVLNSSRYEWQMVNGTTYGEMIPSATNPLKK